jgi:aryl-alcohol dehydrogenase-like predicted oxidoreductase
MEYRLFGRTGVKVSPLCLGCMMFGWKSDQAASTSMVAKALDAGINFLDTANVYSRGVSEQYTGQALKDLGKRDRVLLATKVHGVMNDHDPNMRGNSRRHIIQQCEASLKRLQTDWIDLYQIHRPSSDVPIDETLRAMDDLVRSGKVRYLGTSTFSAWQLVRSFWVAKELGLNRFVCDQPPYNLLDRRLERELVPMALTYGMALIPWSPLAAGFLTGKYRRGEVPAEGRWKGSEGPGGRRLNERAFDVAEKLVAMAAAKGCTASQLAIAWCMSQPGVTSPIIGPNTMAQLEDNLGAVDVKLSDEDRKQIDAVAPPGDVCVKYYEADFGPDKYAVL